MHIFVYIVNKLFYNILNIENSTSEYNTSGIKNEAILIIVHYDKYSSKEQKGNCT